MLLLRASAPTAAQAPAPTGDTLALTGVTVIDGTGSPPKPDMTVLIRAGRIVDLFPTGRKRLPAGTNELRLPGHFVMPGLIDAHYHLLLNRGEPEETLRRRFAFYGGITSARDMAGDAIKLAEVARAAADASVAEPRIYFSAVLAGPTWFSDDRVGLMMHGRPAGQAPWARAVTDDSNIVQVITEAKAAGATGIKMYADLSPALVARLSREAHRQGLKVWSHLTIFPSKPSDAVAAHVDVVSHAVDFVWELVEKMPGELKAASYRTIDWPRMSPDAPAITKLLRAMKRQGTILDATVLVTHDRIVTRQLALAEKERTIKDPQALDAWLFGVTRRAYELGVPLTVGTDVQEAPRRQDLPNIHTEMELLVTRAGLAPLAAIKAATQNGARAIGIERAYGTISKGKVADLVILSADPSRDIRNTTKIVYVVKGGRVHAREKVVMPAN
jgi:imidazolonepropionase-like amidohydrolase